MEKYPTITLYKGATTIIRLDLTEMDMQGGSVVFTVRSKVNRALVKKWVFCESETYDITFSEEMTAQLMTGKGNYEYDIMWHIDGERFPQCGPSDIIVMHTVGGRYG